MKWSLMAAFINFHYNVFLLHGEENPRGMAPVRMLPICLISAGVLNKTYHNQYGQKRDLSECIVLRESKIKEGKAFVPAGGLFYSSETSDDARPFMREPFLILGEHTYLLRSHHKKVIKRNVEVEKRGEGASGSFRIPSMV